MKKLLLMTLCVVTFSALTTVSAAAVVNDTVKVGLRYGDSAMFSANLENAVGEGYFFGWFDEDREFEEIGWTEEIAISMTAAGDIYMSESGAYSADMPSGTHRFMGAWRVQVDGFRDFEEAQDYAWDEGGWPAWIDGEYAVRFGCFDSEAEAEDFAWDLEDGYPVEASSTGVVVTRTRSTEILFEFDCSGVMDLGVQPDGWGEEPATWFRGYKYPGGFEYPRVTGGNLSVYNVVDLEEYVKGVIPYEMDDDWPLAALEAQAVCARTYACRNTTHQSIYGFDVCSATCCQVYYGVGSGGAGPSKMTDRAVENTEGERLYYDGYLVQDAVYHSSNGGATEDAKNVWGTAKGYLIGKEDPYEGAIDIPNYEWSVTYTAEELTWILDQKGYSIGTVKDVYVTEYTPMGNVREIVFEGSRKDLTVTGETCRTIFYSSTLGKSARSMRFSINGAGPVSTGGAIYAGEDGERLDSLEGISVISGSGTLTRLEGDVVSVISSGGVSRAETGGGTVKPGKTRNDGTFTLTGTGNGHNVGMSQYGARAMAELGYDYIDILEFYYTGVTIE